MTIEQLYLNALSMMPSNVSEDDSLRQYMVMWVNLLLRETLKYENALREVQGEELLVEAPTVNTTADIIPYHQQLVENAFIWGIASFMCKDDDDLTHEQDFRGRYISACEEYTPWIQGSVSDMYGECE